MIHNNGIYTSKVFKNIFKYPLFLPYRAKNRSLVLRQGADIIVVYRIKRRYSSACSISTTLRFISIVEASLPRSSKFPFIVAPRTLFFEPEKLNMFCASTSNVYATVISGGIVSFPVNTILKPSLSLTENAACLPLSVTTGSITLLRSLNTGTSSSSLSVE